MASSRYEYILTLNDKMTSVLRRAGAVGGETYDKLQAKQDKLNRSANGFGSLIAKIGLGALAYKFGESWLKAGANIETTRVTFGTLLGDVDKANKLIEELNQFANVTPFDNQSVMQAGRQLLAAQIPAEKISATLQTIGDVASGANVPLNDMVGIYAKAMNKGRVQAEELNQMAERGVPILQTFAKMYGKSTQEVMEMGSQGKLTSKELTKAFEIMTGEGGMFNNMMQKQSETVAGKWSTLTGTIGYAFEKLGEKTNGGISKMLDWLIKGVNWFISKIDTIFNAINNAINWTRTQIASFIDALNNGNPAVMAFTAVLTGIVGALIALKTISLIIIGVTKVWSAVQMIFNTIMMLNPVFLIVAGIIALIALISYVIYKTDGWGKTWDNVMTYIKTTWEQAKATLLLGWLLIKEAFLTGFDVIEAGWYKLQSLWDEDSANKGLKKLKDERDARAREISEAKNKVLELDKKRKEMKVFELTWNKDKSLSDITDGLKKTLGIETPGAVPGGAPPGGTPPAGGLPPDTLTNTSTGIAGGGNRPTNVNITLQNLVQSLTVTPANMKEGASEIERLVREALLRVLNSANGVAYGNQ